MSAHRTAKRYSLILDIIERKKHPTFEDIKDHLVQYDFEISARTLQRDIARIRDEFGMEICYSRASHGYYIDESNSVNKNLFLKFIETSTKAELINRSIHDSKKLLQVIQFDGYTNNYGSQYIEDVLQAIDMHKKIKFLHHNFDTNQYKEHIVHPYYIKEYKNRWYVLGWAETYNELRTFGMDRIQDVIIMKEGYKKVNFDALAYFKDIIGINHPKTKVQKIVLRFTAQQAKYIWALPLHPSQQFINSSNSTEDFEFQLKINYELIQEILALREHVEVLSPLILRNEIKAVIKAMSKQYAQ